MSRKETAFGIGQTPAGMMFAGDHVDLLPWMYIREAVFIGQRLRPISDNLGLVYTFDFATWAWVVGSVVAVFSMLWVIQMIWCLTSGASPPPEYIYQGLKQKKQAKSTVHL